MDLLFIKLESIQKKDKRVGRGNNMNKHISTNRILNSNRFFILLMLLSNLASANNSPSKATPINNTNANHLIDDIKKHKIDILQNKEQIKEVFESTKSQSLSILHFEAAAWYAELLFRQEKYDELNEHINNYLNNSSLPKYPISYLRFLSSKLKYLSEIGDLPPSQKLAKQLELQLSVHTSEEKIIILRALAYHYTAVDDLTKTLNVAAKGLELAVEAGSDGHQAFFLRKIADAYYFLDEKDKGLDYAVKAVVTYEKTNDGLLTAKAHWSLGNAYLQEQETNTALEYLNKALTYFKSVNMQKGLTFSQYSIANILADQGDYAKAITIANDNILQAKTAKVFDMQLASMILLNDIYVNQTLYDKANAVNDQVFLIFDKFSRSVYKSDFLGKRYQLKRQLGYIDEALEAIEKQLFYAKKHLEAMSESNIKALQIKFEVKEKEDEILRLAHENNISELKAKEEYQQKVIWRLITAITLILVIVSLFLFYKQVRQRRKYHSLASTDYLTGSLNRRGIMKVAEKKLHKKELTVAIVDLDNFKRINDQFGHDVGDLILIAFAHAAKQTLRDSDEFGRYGGEEWLFILSATQAPSLQRIFDRLTEHFTNNCKNIKTMYPSIDWNITFSMGAAISASSNNSLDELIKNADKLLYQAKENGRNQLIVG